MTKEQSYFLELILSQLKGVKPPEPYAGVDWKQLYETAKAQSMFNLFYNALLNLEHPPEQKVMAFFRSKYQKKLKITAANEAIYEDAIRLLTANKIRVLPFKGYYIRPLYPKSFYRYSSDLDIITDQTESAKQLLTDAGYVLLKDDAHHYIFTKGGALIELHKTLFVGKMKPFFEDCFEHAHDNEQQPYLCKMDDSYFYACFIAHFAYHFRLAGAGLRSLIDVYYLNASLSIEDYSLIERLGLAAFEKKVRAIAQQLFCQTVTEDDALSFFFLSNTLGVKENIRKLDVAQNGKTKAYFRRFFPSKDTMSTEYAVRSSIQLPYFWIKRLAEKVSDGKQANLNEIARVDEQTERYYRKIVKEFGVDKL